MAQKKFYDNGQQNKEQAKEINRLKEENEFFAEAQLREGLRFIVLRLR